MEGVTLGVENTFQPNSKYVAPTHYPRPTTPQHGGRHPGCEQHLPAQLKVRSTHPSTTLTHQPLNMQDVTLGVENTFQPNSKYVAPTHYPRPTTPQHGGHHPGCGQHLPAQLKVCNTHPLPLPTQQPHQHGGHHPWCGEHLPAQLKVCNTHPSTTLTHPTTPQHGGHHSGCGEHLPAQLKVHNTHTHPPTTLTYPTTPST